LPPASVKLCGENISGFDALPYVESRNNDPTVPRPFTREETNVRAGFKLVVLLGAS